MCCVVEGLLCSSEHILQKSIIEHLCENTGKGRYRISINYALPSSHSPPQPIFSQDNMWILIIHKKLSVFLWFLFTDFLHRHFHEQATKHCSYALRLMYIGECLCFEFVPLLFSFKSSSSYLLCLLTLFLRTERRETYKIGDSWLHIRYQNISLSLRQRVSLWIKISCIIK